MAKFVLQENVQSIWHFLGVGSVDLQKGTVVTSDFDPTKPWETERVTFRVQGGLYDGREYVVTTRYFWLKFQLKPA